MKTKQAKPAKVQKQYSSVEELVRDTCSPEVQKRYWELLLEENHDVMEVTRVLCQAGYFKELTTNTEPEHVARRITDLAKLIVARVQEKP